ncbi:hypothetical protein [Thioalkalivibrio sp. ALJT]|uniref:hypothetical protein n=1 Tax=Thioalkalivibrio sp. ALJT TaxID=1158146 RepID=UPI0003811F29|nr:hypothetical protein [Thioalkalivibrio sp. ALJT]
MSQVLRWIAGLVVILVPGISGCAPDQTQARSDAPEPRPGMVTQMEPFRAFLETRPTPEAFSRVYPDVTLVLPGDVATREYRTDNSRFFAELDEDGHIHDGDFR